MAERRRKNFDAGATSIELDDDTDQAARRRAAAQRRAAQAREANEARNERIRQRTLETKGLAERFGNEKQKAQARARRLENADKFRPDRDISGIIGDALRGGGGTGKSTGGQSGRKRKKRS